MYSTSDKYIRTIHNHTDALMKWERSKPWRGKDKNVRPLGGRRQTWLTVRKEQPSGDIIACMYNTDIVRWHADGRITLTAFTSSSTNTIVNSLIPTVRPEYGAGWGSHSHLLRVWQFNQATEWHDVTMVCMKGSTVTYREVHGDTKDQTRVQWENPARDLVPFPHVHIDRKRANAWYRDSRLSDFLAFRRVWCGLHPEVMDYHYQYGESPAHGAMAKSCPSVPGKWSVTSERKRYLDALTDSSRTLWEAMAYTSRYTAEDKLRGALRMMAPEEYQPLYRTEWRDTVTGQESLAVRRMWRRESGVMEYIGKPPVWGKNP